MLKIITNHIIESIAAMCIRNVSILSEVTRRTVRLYLVEGPQLSTKGGDQSRITWYTNPEVAMDPTVAPREGRLVYVDIVLDCTSDYSHRFYKLGSEAYTLKGELVKLSKRKFKYVKESA